jgi:hypothetical protein
MLYYSINITQRNINQIIFSGFIVVDNTTDIITAFYKDLILTNNIIAPTTNNLNADNLFLNHKFSYNGTTITTFPFLANTYQGTAWNLYYDTSTYRIAYRNYSDEWVDLPFDFTFDYISIPSLPVVIQPIPLCVLNSKKNCMNAALTQKGNKQFNTIGNVTKISKAMRYSQVQQMPKKSICVAQPVIPLQVAENTVSQFKSLKLINNLVTNFSFPNNNGSQIPGQYIACSYNGQYITIVCNSDNNSNNKYGIYVSNDYGNTFKSIVKDNVNFSDNVFYMYSISISYTGQYQFAVSNGRSSTSIGVYYSNNYGVSWNQFLYGSSNGITTNNLRWSQCTCISPTGQYMFAGGGGSGDGFNGAGSGIGGWYDYYSNNYGVSWQFANRLSDRISCTMNATSFDVISVVNFNSATNVFPGLFLKTNHTKNPIQETTISSPDSTSRPFRITSDDNMNVFMIAVNNSNHQFNDGIPDPNQDFINPTTPMFGYYSSDFGNTYQKVPQLPDAFTFIEYNSTGSRLWACSKTTVYYSKNHGASWYTLTTNIADIYGMALSKDGMHLYLIEQNPVNNSGNNIFRANVSAF